MRIVHSVEAKNNWTIILSSHMYTGSETLYASTTVEKCIENCANIEWSDIKGRNKVILVNKPFIQYMFKNQVRQLLDQLEEKIPKTDIGTFEWDVKYD